MRTFAQPTKKTPPTAAWSPPQAAVPSQAPVLPAAHKLQRAIGNRAARDLVQKQSAAQGLVQRNEESAALLKKLAKPQTFAGPDVNLVREMSDALEAQFKALFATMAKEEQALYNPSCLGGIVLNPAKGTELKDLIAGAEFIDLPAQSTKDPRSRAVGKSSYALAQQANIEKGIIFNTLATMDMAGQLEYLRKSGLLDDKGWEILIEVHYYRDRSAGQTKLHKDTLGQTLFVNLNYVNAKPIQGPEFVINPDLGGLALEKTYLEYMQEKLPPEFIKDVEVVKTYYGEPKEIGMSEIPSYGVVAFVDEAIHHKTPTMEHRKVSRGYINSALQKTYGAEYDLAKVAYEKYQKRQAKKGPPSKKTYGSYLKKSKVATANEWYRILDGIKDPDARFDRKELAALFPRPDFLDIEALIEQGGQTDFGEASILYAKRQNVAIKKEGRPPLTRQMSQEMLQGYQPLVSADPRRFFRTWVRAVRKGGGV